MLSATLWIDLRYLEYTVEITENRVHFIFYYM